MMLKMFRGTCDGLALGGERTLSSYPAHLHKGVARGGECTGAERVAFAQHPGRVGRSIPTWGPEERRLSPLENSFRWSASASAPRPVKKLLGLKGFVALAAQALGARSSIHEANHSSSP